MSRHHLFPKRATVSDRKDLEEPILVRFGDGSMEGFMAMVYVVWKRNKGGSEVFLVMAKARVAPLGGTTTPRMEMSLAALLARLMLLVARNSGFKPVEAVMALDSECSVALLQRRDVILRPYFAHRSAEVSDVMVKLQQLIQKVRPMVGVPGDENPADLGTRGKAKALDISPTSRYQLEPAFLQKPREKWPLKSNVCMDSTIDMVRQVHAVSCSLQAVMVEDRGAVVTEAGADLSVVRCLVRWALISLYYTNNWTRSVRTLARVVRVLCKGQEGQGKAEIQAQEEQRGVSRQEYEAACNLQFLVSSPASVAALRRGDLQSLGAERHEGMVWMSGRCSPEDMAAVLGVCQLRVIMPSTRLALLVMTKAHKEDHRADPRDAMARARRVFWIPRRRLLVVRVIKNCGHCRRWRKHVQEQVMGDLPSCK